MFNFILNILKLIKRTIIATLRYYNIYNPKYTVSSKLDFGSFAATEFIKEKIAKSNFFFEFGSGNSTIYANENQIKTISIESDKNFYNYLKKKIKSKYVFIDFGIVDYYSRPLHSKFNINPKIGLKYSSYILKYLDRKIIPDLILIDGRFRIMSAFMVYKFFQNKNSSNVTIILDDYADRENYHILNQLYEIKTIDRIAILVPKQNKNISEELLKKYSLDFN
jgi:hypothetical protein